jgi:hypothetical protein
VAAEAAGGNIKLLCGRLVPAGARAWRSPSVPIMLQRSNFIAPHNPALDKKCLIRRFDDENT